MTPVLRFLPTVTLNGLAPAGARIISALDQATQVLKRDLWVTAGTDSHASDDPHSRGCAIDVRAKDLPDATVIALVTWLRKCLGPDFTVLYETPVPVSGLMASLSPYVNAKATAVHCHIQLRKNFGPYPPADGATTARA